MDVERFLAKRDEITPDSESDNKRKWDEIRRRIDVIKREREKIQNAVVPQTWDQRARQKIISLLPLVREQLSTAPLTKLSVEIRQLIFDVRNSMPEVLAQARAIVDFADDVQGLLDQMKENPVNEEEAAENERVIQQLDFLLNEDAKKKLQLPKDDTAAEFIKYVQAKDPNFQEKFRKRTFDRATRHLSLEEPYINAARVILVSSVDELSGLIGLYGEVERYKDAIDGLHRTAGYILRGEELGIISWNTAIGELEQVVKAAGVVYDAVELGRSFADPERLLKLKKDSDEVAARLLGLRSPDENEKALPEAKVASFKEII